MCEEFKNQLEWINENLNTLAQNQVMLYNELHELKMKIEEKRSDKEKDATDKSKIF
jgi:chaperonin cofactor prefoldin